MPRDYLRKKARPTVLDKGSTLCPAAASLARKKTRRRRPAARRSHARICRRAGSSDEESEDEDTEGQAKLPSGAKRVDVGALEEQDFLLLLLKGRGKQKGYVAQVKKVNPLMVVYLRQTGKQTFTLPCDEQLYSTDASQIVGKIDTIVPDRRMTMWTVSFNILTV
jgi:hypothetical protein